MTHMIYNFLMKHLKFIITNYSWFAQKKEYLEKKRISRKPKRVLTMDDS